jgi:hypothetical protein
MSRRPANVTQADIARAIRAAQQCEAGAVEVKPDGTIRIAITPEFAVHPTQPPLEESIASSTPVVL